MKQFSPLFFSSLGGSSVDATVGEGHARARALHGRVRAVRVLAHAAGGEHRGTLAAARVESYLGTRARVDHSSKYWDMDFMFDIYFQNRCFYGKKTINNGCDIEVYPDLRVD